MGAAGAIHAGPWAEAGTLRETHGVCELSSPTTAAFILLWMMGGAQLLGVHAPHGAQIPGALAAPRRSSFSGTLVISSQARPMPLGTHPTPICSPAGIGGLRQEGLGLAAAPQGDPSLAQIRRQFPAARPAFNNEHLPPFDEDSRASLLGGL